MRDGSADGFGTETYPDGAAYEGEFRDGAREGTGAYYFANGKVVGLLCHHARRVSVMVDTISSRMNRGPETSTLLLAST